VDTLELAGGSPALGSGRPDGIADFEFRIADLNAIGDERENVPDTFRAVTA
jgi:hypothetical protein